MRIRLVGMNGTTPHASDSSDERRARLDALCAAGWEHWEEFDATVRLRDFHPFVASDYDAVRRTLELYCRPGQRFLEWGSANGVITIMADLLGCEAYGIELDSDLVRTARALASRFESKAQFVNASFLPSGFRWENPEDPGYTSTIGIGDSGYVQLGKALDDFDIVFGYPWDGDVNLMLELMRQYGRSDATLLLFHTSAGVMVYQDGRALRQPPP